MHVCTLACHVAFHACATQVLMLNFNHERFGIAVTVARGARLCFAEAFKHALERKTFGKPLVKHQIIRFKLAEMARQVRKCVALTAACRPRTNTSTNTTYTRTRAAAFVRTRARQVEALQDFVERVAYQFSCGVPDSRLGGMCALLKVQASKTFEYCAREASQIFGGSSIVKACMRARSTAARGSSYISCWIGRSCAGY